MGRGKKFTPKGPWKKGKKNKSSGFKQHRRGPGVSMRSGVGASAGAGAGGGLFVVGSAQSQLFQAHASTFSNPRSGSASLFNRNQRVLLVGEGDFSFAAALALSFGGSKITATSFDSGATCREKYPATAAVNIHALVEAGADVRHGVDATALNMSTMPWLAGPSGTDKQSSSAERGSRPVRPASDADAVFDRIGFNFPHVGGATQEDVAKNQALLRDFFRAAAPLLRRPGAGGAGKQGLLLLTLRTSAFYASWDPIAQARACGLKLHKRLPFDTADYPAYKPVRTEPGFREAPDAIDAEMFAFTPEKSNFVRMPEPEKSVPQAEATADAGAAAAVTGVTAVSSKKAARRARKAARKAAAQRLQSADHDQADVLQESAERVAHDDVDDPTMDAAFERFLAARAQTTATTQPSVQLESEPDTKSNKRKKDRSSAKTKAEVSMLRTSRDDAMSSTAKVERKQKRKRLRAALDVQRFLTG